jgi:sarcosine oxidase, subunit gamma
MADALTARTPLGGDLANGLRKHGDAAVVQLRELPASTMIDLRLDPADRAQLDSAQSTLGFALPLTPGKTAACENRLAIWFGPDQWLVVAPTADAGTLMRAFDMHALSAVDVSDLRAAFELTGRRARDVLAKGCAIDLHPRAFGPGDCALTALARVRVALHQVQTEPTYRTLVERSVAPYLWDWLVDAMLEFTGE